MKKDKTTRQLIRFGKDQMCQQLLKLQMLPKVGLVWSHLIPVLQFFIAGYSFNVQHSLHSPYSLISCPQSSKWQQKMGKINVQQRKAMQGSRKYWYWAFSPFFCLFCLLTSYIKVQWSPQVAKDSPAPLQRNAGRQHTAAISTQVYHVVRTTNHRPVLSGFKI